MKNTVIYGGDSLKMPVLDNGDALRINRCPECGSKISCYPKLDDDIDGAKCDVCDWKGNRSKVLVEKKPF